MSKLDIIIAHADVTYIEIEQRPETVDLAEFFTVKVGFESGGGFTTSDWTLDGALDNVIERL